MGGDFAPFEVIKGALLALAENKNLEIVLVGRFEEIKKELGTENKRITIERAEEVIEMDEPPTQAIKSKLRSSIVIGTRMVREGKGDAFVSAGNTGAVVAASLLNIGRIKGISRPAIGIVIPTPTRPVVLIDAGANADCKPENLYHFALLGKVYIQSLHSVSQPKIGLLNIGEEKGKGNELTKEAYKLLESSNLNFIGNIEGGEIFQGKADVVVCDGFTGNVILKVAEGLAETLMAEVKEAVGSTLFSKIGGLLVKPSFKKLAQRLSYDEYGGAKLLGINGVVVISHGKSNAKAIKNAIQFSYETVKNEVVAKIKEELKTFN